MEDNMSQGCQQVTQTVSILCAILTEETKRIEFIFEYENVMYHGEKGTTQPCSQPLPTEQPTMRMHPLKPPAEHSSLYNLIEFFGKIQSR